MASNHACVFVCVVPLIVEQTRDDLQSLTFSVCLSVSVFVSVSPRGSMDSPRAGGSEKSATTSATSDGGGYSTCSAHLPARRLDFLQGAR